MKKLVHVAVGVIFDSQKEHILIAKRADHQHQGGLWEFPGGKVEAGESIQVALQRELEEELGLVSSPNDMQPLITIPFHYPDKSVLLDVWAVYGSEGFNDALNEKAIDEQTIDKQALGKEGQPLAWVALTDLRNYEFPAANKAIIDALLLPKKIAITQDNHDAEVILKQAANTLKNHKNTWLQLRAPSLSQRQYTQLAMKLYGICHEAGSKLIWNCPVAWYQVAFADGLHLSRRNFSAVAGRPIPMTQWLSTACHNLAELESAQKQVDYVLVSPVKETSTHANANALTWAGFSVITDKAHIPCYALGGMRLSGLDDSESDISKCAQFGGQGIAGISCFLAC